MSGPPHAANSHAHQPDFRARLRDELARRRLVNRRYSVRAFAEFLGVDHSTLAQILKHRRAVPPQRLADWCARLGVGAQEAALYAAAAQTDDRDDLARRVQRMHWLAEAGAVLARPAHWRLLQLMREPDWRPDTRWAARRIGTGVDDVNDALSRLLRLGMVSTDAHRTWRDATQLAEPSEQAVKECALARMRAEWSAGGAADQHEGHSLRIG
jgi:transcriptional regulator with XRE-family HTH domain